MNLPRRRKHKPLGVRVSSVIRCPGHLQWVRGCECAAKATVQLAMGCYPCWGRIEAHHVRTRGAGGGDEQVAPLCRGHHAQLDSPGWSAARFEQVYKINLAEIAAKLWLISPAGKRYRAKESGHEQEN